MALADMVWRTHAKYGSALFLTSCSFGFLYTVVHNSTPLDDARAWWTGEGQVRRYQLRMASGAGPTN